MHILVCICLHLQTKARAECVVLPAVAKPFVASQIHLCTYLIMLAVQRSSLGFFFQLTFLSQGFKVENVRNWKNSYASFGKFYFLWWSHLISTNYEHHMLLLSAAHVAAAVDVHILLPLAWQLLGRGIACWILQFFCICCVASSPHCG